MQIEVVGVDPSRRNAELVRQDGGRDNGDYGTVVDGSQSRSVAPPAYEAD